MSVRVNERSDYFKLINWHHVAAKCGMAGCAKQHHQQYQSIQHFEKKWLPVFLLFVQTRIRKQFTLQP